MEICYYALKKTEVGTPHGTRVAEVGDLIPEAAYWPFINGYVQEGRLAVCRVSSLFEDEIAAIEEWERTGHFTLYDERNGTMTERDMRPTSSVSEDERIDGSDKNILEGEGIPEPPVVDESSETTPKLVEQMEEADAEARGVEVGGEEGEVEEVEDYNELTVTQLKAELDGRGISYASNATKADLVALLEQDDAAAE